jgi:ketosteroid isomerase-like protein
MGPTASRVFQIRQQGLTYEAQRGSELVSMDQAEFDEAIRAGYAALNRGDEPSLDLIDDRFEGVNLPEEPLGVPAMKGREGLLAWIQGVREVWDAFQLVPERITWLKPDVVLVQVLLEGRGKSSAVPVSQRFYNLWTIHNGRAVRMEVHRTETDALRVARLS